MSISAILISIGMLVSYEAGCTKSPFECNASCVTEAQAEESRQFCQGKSCGGCGIIAPDNECYEKFGQCVKSSNGCGWKESPELKECIEKANKSRAKTDDFTTEIFKGTNLKPRTFEEWDRDLRKKQ